MDSLDSFDIKYELEIELCIEYVLGVWRDIWSINGGYYRQFKIK